MQSLLTYTLRPATLEDAAIMGSLAATSYMNASFSAILFPRRHCYIAEQARAYQQRILSRMVSPRKKTLVAVLPCGLPIAYVQFQRLGNGAPAENWASRLRALFIAARNWVDVHVWGFVDRSMDLEAFVSFGQEGKGYWVDSPEERWYVQSLVVGGAWQRRGVGKALMGVVLGMARDEGVMVGLEASEDGEPMYRSLGFGLRMRFKEGDVAGGVMEWFPEGKKCGVVEAEACVGP